MPKFGLHESYKKWDNRLAQGNNTIGEHTAKRHERSYGGGGKESVVMTCTAKPKWYESM